MDAIFVNDSNTEVWQIQDEAFLERNGWGPCSWPRKLKATLLFCIKLPSCFLWPPELSGKAFSAGLMHYEGADSMATPGGAGTEQASSLGQE